MELVSITVRFDSPEEQSRAEERAKGIRAISRETWPSGSEYSSWTEFDLSGCEPEDVAAFFGEAKQ